MSNSFFGGWRSVSRAVNSIGSSVSSVGSTLGLDNWEISVGRHAGDLFSETGELIKNTVSGAIKDIAYAGQELAVELEAAAKQGAIESAQIIYRKLKIWWDNLWRRAKDYAVEQLNEAYDGFYNEYVVTYTNEIQIRFAEAIREIKDYVNTLKELLEIKKLIQRILDQCEVMLEEYLKSRLTFLELIESKGEPVIELSLEGFTLKFELYIFIVPMIYRGNEYEKECFLKLSLIIEQEITHLEAPSVRFEFIPYEDRAIGDLMENVEKKMNEEQDRLIQELITSLFSEYLEVFNQFKKYLDLIK